jgi:hypothetical protein
MNWLRFHNIVTVFARETEIFFLRKWGYGELANIRCAIQVLGATNKGTPVLLPTDLP